MPRARRHAVVLAGGSGTRFWPRSRRRTPKQLLAITSARTLLDETLARLGRVVARGDRWIVTGRPYAAAVRRHLRGQGHVLVEPVGRNTAAAIALAALEIGRRSPGASMVVLPADHTVGDAAAFRATIERALAVAETTGALVTLGIEPTRAETGYGYIEVGGPIDDGGAAAHWAARFIEKPDLARATALLATGRVLWNAGMFAWRVDAVLEALRRWVPEVVGPLERAQAQGGSAALARAYGRIPSVSIDTGVLERAERVAVVRAAFPWNDVGSWAAVESEWRRTGTENAVRGRVLAIESRGCVVDAPARLVALLGVEDLVVVDTPDALLVCPKARAQDVRLLVDALARRGLGQYL